MRDSPSLITLPSLPSLLTSLTNCPPPVAILDGSFVCLVLWFFVGLLFFLFHFVLLQGDEWGIIYTSNYPYTTQITSFCRKLDSPVELCVRHAPIPRDFHELNIMIVLKHKYIHIVAKHVNNIKQLFLWAANEYYL